MTPNKNRFASGLKWPVLIFTAIWMVSVSFLSDPARGAEAVPDDFTPLFPIRIDHEFPNFAQRFEDIKALILANYYSDQIDEASLYWAAVEGMLRRISPPQTPGLSKIWTEKEYEAIRQSLQGEQVSIGIRSTFNSEEGSLTVTEIMPGSPAESILKERDRILRIDANPLQGRSLSEVNEMMSGAEGQTITLTVNRDIKVFTVTIQCQKFEESNLVVTPLTRTAAVVEIKRFTAGISKEMEKVLLELKTDRYQSLIIDLRNNPGGVFVEALKIAELFLPKNSILLRIYQRETRFQKYVSSKETPLAFELAVLVNHRTASSAEILAGCLQDHQKALLVGSRTYGKGIFEKTFALEDGLRVKFITGAMYSPKGVSWHGKGIVPDFLVQQDDKLLTALLKEDPKSRYSRDVGLITAVKLLTMNRR